MGKNFNGTQINQSPTISEKAGADVADIRNLILKYDTDGNVVVAADGTAPYLYPSDIHTGEYIPSDQKLQSAISLFQQSDPVICNHSWKKTFLTEHLFFLSSIF